jgi:hypothetical protein
LGAPVVPEPLKFVYGDRVGDFRARFVNGHEQRVFADQDLGIQQVDAVGEHLAAVVVVQHPGDRAQFHHRQHQQHCGRRVLQHDGDHIAALDAACGQHCRIPVGGFVGPTIGHSFVFESDEHLIAVPCRAVLENLTDRGLGRLTSQESGQHAAHDDRRIDEQTRQPAGDIGQPDGVVIHAFSPLVPRHIRRLHQRLRRIAASRPNVVRQKRSAVVKPC